MGNVYVHRDGSYDRSRWLSVSWADRGTLVLELADLCQPGKVSGLARATLDVDLVRSALANGAVQLTNSLGYVLIRRTDELVGIEFRCHDDVSASRATVLCSDLEAALAAEPIGSRASAL
jgi:hypothetical protein